MVVVVVVVVIVVVIIGGGVVVVVGHRSKRYIVVEAEVEAKPEGVAVEVQVQVLGEPVRLRKMGYRLGIAKASLKSMRFFSAGSGGCIIICL